MAFRRIRARGGGEEEGTGRKKPKKPSSPLPGSGRGIRLWWAVRGGGASSWRFAGDERAISAATPTMDSARFLVRVERDPPRSDACWLRPYGSRSRRCPPSRLWQREQVVPAVVDGDRMPGFQIRVWRGPRFYIYIYTSLLQDTPTRCLCSCVARNFLTTPRFVLPAVRDL